MALKGKAPVEKTQGKAKICIFSKSGIGKTWFSLDFPKCYYFDTENGADKAHYQKKLASSGGVYFGVKDGSLDFPTVINELKELSKGGHDFRTVCIGSVTKLWQIAIANEQERLGERDQFGASKKPAIAYMRQLVNWIHRIDMNVVFEAHEIGEWAMVGKERQEVGQVPDVWDKLPYELDLVLRIIRAGDKRIFQVKKSRLTGFPETETFPAEFSEFAQRYGIDYINGDCMPLALATPEQVNEISEILKTIRIDEKEIERILTKAQAATWADVSEADAVKIIKSLKGKIK